MQRLSAFDQPWVLSSSHLPRLCPSQLSKTNVFISLFSKKLFMPLQCLHIKLLSSETRPSQPSQPHQALWQLLHALPGLGRAGRRLLSRPMNTSKLGRSPRLPPTAQVCQTLKAHGPALGSQEVCLSACSIFFSFLKLALEKLLM